MKRFRIPGLLDILLAKDVTEVKALAGNPLVDRLYADRSLLLNGYILRRVRKVLQLQGKPFPTVAPREAPGRAAAQTALWSRLGAMTQHLKTGPDELESLAAFVRGQHGSDGCGLLVQQVVGRLFAPDFKATSASWQAALVLDKAPRTINPALLVWWTLTRRVERARRLLAGIVGGDLAGVHAVGIALHNIVSGVSLMQQLFLDPRTRDTLSPETAGTRCLFAPGSVLRQPTASIPYGGGELTTETLILLNLQDANVNVPGTDVVFLQDTWSRCPAEQWVPALLEGIWRRAGNLAPTAGVRGDRSECPFAPPPPSPG